MINFGKNIYYLRTNKGINQKEIAEDLGFSRTQWSNYESNVSYPKFLDLIKISKYFGISEGDLIHLDLGKTQDPFSITLAKTSSKSLEKSLEAQEIPLYSLESSFGLVDLFSESSNIPPIDTIRIPTLPKCDAAVFVFGDSMYPLLKGGDIILYKKIDNIGNDFIWGQIYLVSFLSNGKEQVMVNYVQKSPRGEAYITLVSENKHHQDKDVQVDKIVALALVKGSVRFYTMS